MEENIDSDAFFNEILFRLEENERDEIALKSKTGQNPGVSAKEVLYPLLGKTEKQILKTALGFSGLSEVQTLSAKELGKDPYFSLLSKVEEASFGSIRFGWETLEANRFFLAGDKRAADEVFHEYSPLGILDEPLDYPVLEKDGVPWMSLVPHELLTMKEPIRKAKGKVATCGLGLGYFAFSASQKEDVSEVHVYELDPEIIDFFQTRLLPLFPHKEKIIIHQKDAFSYVEDGPYDFVFVDTYHNADDGTPQYLRYLAIENGKSRVAYWIEGTLLCYFRRAVIYSLACRDESESFLKEEIPLIYASWRALKEAGIPKNLGRFLSDDGLKEFAKLVASKI